jgi:hypothetical protein
VAGPQVPIPPHVALRAATRYEPDGEHWLSTYSVASHGYAQIGWKDDDGRMRGTTAHRAAWAHHHGDPGPDTVDHVPELCRERRCVRPDHLRSIPNLENARRTLGRNWPLGTCRHGHDHATHWHPKSATNAKGYCRACQAAKHRRRTARRRAAA